MDIKGYVSKTAKDETIRALAKWEKWTKRMIIENRRRAYTGLTIGRIGSTEGEESKQLWSLCAQDRMEIL
jgi:hypothetical protein